MCNPVDEARGAKAAFLLVAPKEENADATDSPARATAAEEKTDRILKFCGLVSNEGC